MWSIWKIEIFPMYRTSNASILRDDSLSRIHFFTNWFKILLKSPYKPSYLRHIWGISQEYLRLISGISLANLRQISGISQKNPNHISGISQVYRMHISSISTEYLQNISGKSQAYLRHISVISQVNLRIISVISQAGLGVSHVFEMFRNDFSTSDHECRDDQVFSWVATISWADNLT